jgi:hypothetical protein
LKALTMHPEHAHSVAHLGKIIENRTRKPWAKLIGERIAIHAGQYIGGRKGKPGGDEGMTALWRACVAADVYPNFNKHRRLAGLRAPLPIVCSAVVCTAVLVRCEKNEGQPPPPWALPSPYWWHLADVELLPEPAPCKGAQGFWEWPR